MRARRGGKVPVTLGRVRAYVQQGTETMTVEASAS
jgi:hypothetical protein